MVQHRLSKQRGLILRRHVVERYVGERHSTQYDGRYLEADGSWDVRLEDGTIANWVEAEMPMIQRPEMARSRRPEDA